MTAFLLVIIILILLAMAGLLGSVFLGLAAIVIVLLLIAYDLLWLAIVVPVAAFIGFIAWVALDDWRRGQLSREERKRQVLDWEEARKRARKRKWEAKKRLEAIERRRKPLRDE